jgi:NNP family nitrate/nitrite transporter-like MFS transporter
MRHALSTATRADRNRAIGLARWHSPSIFAVWTIFAVSGVQIKADLGLNDTQFGLRPVRPSRPGR